MYEWRSSLDVLCVYNKGFFSQLAYKFDTSGAQYIDIKNERGKGVEYKDLGLQQYQYK